MSANADNRIQFLPALAYWLRKQQLERETADRQT